MAISWGPPSGHMQVGIDVRHDPVGPGVTAITVYVDYYVASVAWGFSEGQVLNLQHSITGAHSYTMSSGTGQSIVKHVVTRTIAAQLGAVPGPTMTFGAIVSDHYQGATPSHTVTFTVPARSYSLPGAPTISRAQLTHNEAGIAVTPPSNDGGAAIDGYVVQVDQDPGFGSPDVQWGGGSGTAGGLRRATDYYARARAHNAAGWGPWSSTLSFRTLATTPSVVPHVAARAQLSDTAIVDWSLPADDGGSAITGYEVQAATNSTFGTGVKTYPSNGATRSLAATGLSPSTPYWIRVRPFNAIGAGPWSAAATLSTLSGAAVKVNGAWVTAKVWVKQNGAWIVAKVYKKRSGEWVL